MSSKTVTWKQLNAGILQMPKDMQAKALPAVRKTIYNEMAVLERLAEILAYTAQTGTKPSLKTGGLKKTIERFANTKNKFKAYVVLGHKMRKGGGGNQAFPAYYSRFQLGGYSVGKATQLELYQARKRGALNKTQTKQDIRASRKKSGNRFVQGKNYFERTDGAATYRVEEKAFKEALRQVDKMLEAI